MKQQVKKAIAEAEDAGGPPSAWADGIAQPFTEEHDNRLGGDSGNTDGGAAPPLLLTAVQAGAGLVGESRGNAGAMDSGGPSDGGQCAANLIADVEGSYLRDISEYE